MHIFFTLLAGYIGVLLLVSWYAGKNETEEDYLIAGRNRPWWQIAFSKYAVTIGAAWYITYTAFAYEYGVNVLTLIVGIAVGYVFFAYWGAPRIKAISETAGGLYTVGAVLRETVKSDHASRLVDFVVLISTILYLTVGVVAGGVLMESFGIVSYEFAVLLTFVVVVLYVLISGYKAVVLTDVVQGIVMLILLGVVVYGFWALPEVTPEMVFEGRSIDILTVIIFAVFGIASTFSAPERYQLSYAGKNSTELKKGFTFAFIPIFVTAVALILVGSIMYAISPGLDGAAVFPDALTKFLSPELVPFALVMFFAGLMSSADTAIYVIASHLQTFGLKQITRNSTKKILIIVGVLSVLIALVFRDVIDLTILAAGIQTALAFPMLYIVAGGRGSFRFSAMLYGGLIGVAVGISVFGLEPKAAAFVLLGNLLGYIISLAHRPHRASD